MDGGGLTCLMYTSGVSEPACMAFSKAYKVSSMAKSSAWPSRACFDRTSAGTMAVSGLTSPALVMTLRLPGFCQHHFRAARASAMPIASLMRVTIAGRASHTD